MQNRSLESGQALILITLGIFGVLAFIGLGLDSGHAFSDRRQAQNAADAAALAAAVADLDHQDYSAAALNKLKLNGYANDGKTSIAEVNNPPRDGSFTCQLRPSDCSDFIQVKLKSVVSTWFASIVGIGTITNQVSAVVRFNRSIQEPFYNGAAIVALNKTVCHAVEISGKGKVFVSGGGIYDNSSCNSTNTQKAFFMNGNSFLQAPYVKVVGGFYADPVSLNLDSPITSGAPHLFPLKNSYNLPAPLCGADGQVDPENPNIALPGNYGDFPPDGVNELAPGIYCVDNFKVHHDLTGEGILIVLNGGVVLNGNASISLKAKTQGDFAGLLMYMPPSHQQQITINGNGSSEFVGLILAPSAPITILGTGKSGRFKSQIIADTITLKGTSNLEFLYEEDLNYQPMTHFRIELVH